jgi:hypothetical protein
MKHKFSKEGNLTPNEDNSKKSPKRRRKKAKNGESRSIQKA